MAYVGDGNNMAHSLMYGCAKVGMHINIVCPASHGPKAHILENAQADGTETGAEIRVVHDPKAGVDGADVVYTDVWASMGQEKEAQERKKIFAPFQVNDELMACAKSEAFFMHCLPAHRGEEVTDSVMDSWRSIVFDEAENRLHAHKAIMLLLMAPELSAEE